MRARDTLLRLHRFRAEEKRRQAADIETMIADFQRKEADLTQQIRAEEERAGVSDPGHFKYPTAAKAALARRDNLLKSISDLGPQLQQAKVQLEEELSELRKIELLAEKDDDLRRPSATPPGPPLPAGTGFGAR
jgi:flagellar FliJ protein